MKHLIAYLLTSLFIVNAFTQTIAHIKGGEEQYNHIDLGIYNSDSGSVTKVVYIGWKNSDFAGLKKIPINTIVFSKYDKSLKFLNTKTYLNADKESKYYKYFILSDKLYIIYHRDNSKNNISYFYAICLDKNTLETKGDEIPIGAFSDINSMYSLDYFFSSLKIKYSSDSSMILFSTSYQQKNNYRNYTMLVFDKKMQKLWRKSFELPFEDNLIKVHSNFVTNNGQVGVLIGKKNKKTDLETETNLLLYNDQSSIPNEIKINVSNRIVNMIDIVKDDIHKLSFFGLCYEEKGEHINSLFLGDIDLNAKNFTLLKIDTLPQRLFQEIYGKTKKPILGLDPNFKLVTVIFGENNTIDYLLEYYQRTEPGSQYQDSRQVTEFNTNSGTYSNRTLYTTKTSQYLVEDYGNILDFHLQKNELINVSNIPRSSKASFKYLYYRNSIYLFYTDSHIRLENNGELEKVCANNDKDGECYIAAIIDKSGSITRQGIISEKELGSQISIEKSIITYPNKLFYIATSFSLFKGRKKSLGYLEIQ